MISGSLLKISYNNVFGYYLEVRNRFKEQVPEEWIRKQTLVSAERYITEELKEYEHKILSADLVQEEGTPGLLLDNNLTIGCKQNSIRINLIQKEGKNIQKCKEFLLGSNLKKGSILK